MPSAAFVSGESKPRGGSIGLGPSVHELVTHQPLQPCPSPSRGLSWPPRWENEPQPTSFPPRVGVQRGQDTDRVGPRVGLTVVSGLSLGFLVCR